MGTILYRFYNLDNWCISIKWDSGSNLSMIEGKDYYEVMEKMNNEIGIDRNRNYYLVNLSYFCVSFAY